MGRHWILLTAILVVAACGAPKPGQMQARAADGMIMLYVPAGEFIQGRIDPPEGLIAEPSCYFDINGKLVCPPYYRLTPRPPTRGNLDAFWIDRTEVTNSQYRRCVQAGTCSKPTCWDDNSFNADNQPVVCVTWYDAATYCKWVGARLPTDPEWQKAARGTDGRAYPWGNEFDGTLANFCDKSCEFNWRDKVSDDGYRRTAPVGSYPKGASPYGALDMSGNVAEWDGEDYQPDDVWVHGGSWRDGWDRVSVSERYLIGDPLWTTIGFRCAASAER